MTSRFEPCHTIIGKQQIRTTNGWGRNRRRVNGAGNSAITIRGSPVGTALLAGRSVPNHANGTAMRHGNENNEPLSEQYRIVAKAWVDADAAANLLEEAKSATLSQWMLELGDKPVSRAEMEVKGSSRWLDYIDRMVTERKRANKLKVQLEYIRMRAMEHQSAEASKRAEMRL